MIIWHNDSPCWQSSEENARTHLSGTLTKVYGSPPPNIDDPNVPAHVLQYDTVIIDADDFDQAVSGDRYMSLNNKKIRWDNHTWIITHISRSCYRDDIYYTIDIKRVLL